MSRRWKSPQAAARQSARAARQAAQLRRESWKAWVLVTSAIMAAATALALYSWSYINVHRKAQQRHQQRLSGTNSPVPMSLSNSVVMPASKTVLPGQP